MRGTFSGLQKIPIHDVLQQHIYDYYCAEFRYN